MINELTVLAIYLPLIWASQFNIKSHQSWRLTQHVRELTDLQENLQA